MPVEKSAGAIIFRKPRTRTPHESKLRTGQVSSVRGREGQILFLLLHYPSNAKSKKEYWDLPKGHIEKGENELDTVKREVEEETGLKDIDFIEGFKETIKYFFKWEGRNILKFVIFYLAETKTKDVKISGEHVGYKWLSYEDALKQLTFKNAKEILKKANTFLQGA